MSNQTDPFKDYCKPHHIHSATRKCIGCGKTYEELKLDRYIDKRIDEKLSGKDKNIVN